MKTMVELISWFQMEYPELAHKMKTCSHHLIGFDEDDSPVLEWMFPVNLNPFHLESDVFTHTMLVCKQAENAPYLVQIAALLHDIGKPSTRKVNPKNGRVSFYNHDAVSAFMSLGITKKLGLSEKERAHVFNLIALHTQIYKLSVEQLAKIYDKFLVYDLIELGNADHSGRFHTQGEAVIPSMLDIPFRNKDERGTTKEVHILCGLPASGKSTFEAKNLDHCRRVCRDEILMDQFRDVGDWSIPYEEAFKKVDQKKVDKLLQKAFKTSILGEDEIGQEWEDVVIDMTHMSKKSRRRSLSHFGAEYKKVCHVFLTDLETMYLRNSERSGKVIGQSVFDKMIRSFYPPTLEEFDEIEYHF